jgi:hypothetical protein
MTRPASISQIVIVVEGGTTLMLFSLAGVAVVFSKSWMLDTGELF